MAGKLFGVAVTERPRKKKDEDEEPMDGVVIAPMWVVARDEKAAAMKVMLDHPELKEKDLDRLEVHVRPF